MQAPFPRHHRHLLRYMDFAETFYVHLYEGFTLFDLTAVPQHHFFIFTGIKLTQILLKA